MTFAERIGRLDANDGHAPLYKQLQRALREAIQKKVLSPDDARALGSTTPRINGSDLFEAQGASWLVVSPEGPVDGPDGTFDGYRGCLVVAIEDLDAGRVARCVGVPVVRTAYLG